MKQKHLVSLRDYSRADLVEIFDLARRMKADPRRSATRSAGRTLAMIFQKPSTRTRVSFEAGMYQLGGHALNLGANDIQLRRGETVADTARVLSRYVDGIMARVFSHEDLVEMSRHATIPVINGLSDLSHPVQALADFMTLLERRGPARRREARLRRRREQRVPLADAGRGEAGGRDVGGRARRLRARTRSS